MSTSKIKVPTEEEVNNISSFLKFIELHKSSDIEHLLKEALDKKNSEFALAWAILYKKARIPEVESYIANTIKSEGKQLTDYTKTVLLTYLKNFPNQITSGDLFDAVLSNPELCLIVAMYVTQGRFLEGEPEIMKEESIRTSYINYLKLLNINPSSLGGSN